MLRSFAIVALLGSSALADGFVASARLGATHLDDEDGDFDQMPIGWGFAGGLSLGYSIGRFTPSLALDGATYGGAQYDAINGEGRFRQELYAISTKVAIDLGAGISVNAGIGLGADREGPDFTSHGYRLEIGVGYRVWHDAENAVRIELDGAQWTMTNPSERYSHQVNQYGTTVAFERRL